MMYITPDHLRKRILEIVAPYLDNTFQYKTLDSWKQTNHEEFSIETENLFQEILALVNNVNYPHTFESTANEVSQDYPLLKPIFNELMQFDGNSQKSGELILKQFYHYHRIL